MAKHEVDVTTGIIFRTVLILVGILFLYLTLDILALLFIAVIIASAMNPAIDWMEKKRVPRTAGVLILYLLLILVIGAVIFFIGPSIASQANDFYQKLPQYLTGVHDSINSLRDSFSAKNINLNYQGLQSSVDGVVSNLPSNIFFGTIGIFSGFISAIIALSLAFYMSIERDGIKKFVVMLVPESHKNYALSLVERIQSKIGKWLLGQLLLMLIIFVLDSVGLYLIGVPYPLILGAFAGLMEIIAYIGPIISAVPGIILGFFISPTIGFLAMLVYLVAQQIEGNIIVPQIMKKAVGLNPIAVILALLIGVKLGGVLGAVLAIPVATAIGLFLGDIMNRRKDAVVS